MASISQLKSELAQFEILKVQMKSVSNSLSTSSTTVNGINDILKTHYSINDSGSNLNNQAVSIGNDIAETSNYLKNTVIPAIDSKMEEIRNEIRRLEEEERLEEERRRREQERAEEERRQKEQERLAEERRKQEQLRTPQTIKSSIRSKI